jgi:hypothetical protein
MRRPVAPIGSLALLALAAGALSAPQVRAAAPCCSIVAVDRDTGVVSLRDNKSGKVEKVTVKDRGTLAKLAPGQQADRSIGQRIRYCSIRTFEPCLDQERSHDCQPCPN